MNKIKILNILVTSFLIFSTGIYDIHAKGSVLKKASLTKKASANNSNLSALTKISFYDENKAPIANTDINLDNSSKLLKVPSDAHYISATTTIANNPYTLFTMAQINNIDISANLVPQKASSSSQQVTTLFFYDENKAVIPNSTIYMNSNDKSVSIPTNAAYISANFKIANQTYQLFTMTQIENFDSTPPAASSNNIMTSLSFYNENKNLIPNATISINSSAQVIKMPYSSYISATVTIDNKTYPVFTMAKIENFDPNPEA